MRLDGGQRAISFLGTRHRPQECQVSSQKVAVIGLGYVGLPLSLAFARQGAAVVGIDTDPSKPPVLNAGRSYIEHIPAAAIREAVEAGRFRATTGFAELAGCDAILICVPTPLTVNRAPDLSFVEATAQAIAPHLRPGQLVVLESTTYPGTTDEVVREILETGSGLTAGKDFYLAFSPEREDPGNPLGLRQIPNNVVGGLTPACLERAGG